MTTRMPWAGALAAALVLAAAGTTGAQNAEAARILQRFDDLRPSGQALAMYRLDWEPSLEAALARAAKEKRPVCLVLIHAQYGDIFSGHC
ncbi:MAG: hypothetical protein HKO57_04405 [Akkermansiaceae bacterium]|nr:hypothetical protein [Akkermansiaceae bacterium]